MTVPVLRIEDLSLDFATIAGPVHALRGVAMDVPKGEIVGIVGESGSGKSTLAMVIMRLLATNARITSGRVVFAGRDLLTLSEEEMRAIRGDRIAMVFQDPMTSLNPVRSIGQQMCDIQHRDHASRTAQKREKVAAALRKVGIPDAESQLDNYPFQFSGGMRQRIAIAMALLMNPSLLIADEPTTALAVTLEAQIIALLRELHDKFQTSMMFVSHNLGLIAELCDEVVVMYAGEVVEQGPVRSLFHDARHPYTRALLECDPARIAQSTRELPTIPGEVPNLIHLPAGCVFRPRCTKAFDPCGQKAPSPRPVADGHAARCYLLGHG